MEMEDKTNRPFIIHPWKTMMAVFLVAVIVLFLTLTLLFMSRGELSTQFPFEMPVWAWVGLIILGISSFFLEKSRSELKAHRFDSSLFWLRITAILGLVFIGTQIAFFGDLAGQNILIGQNNGGGYLYILTGLHGTHVLAGCLVLVLTMRAIRKRPDSHKTPLTFSVGSFFWHFLGGLWVYLVMIIFMMR